MERTYIDLTGQRFGKLTVIEKGKPHITKGGAYITTWVCKCDCGNTKIVASQKLRNHTTVSCGCYRNKKVSEVNFTDLTGKRFGRLTVLKYIPQNERENERRNWLCQCDCGNIVSVEGAKLNFGHTKSCGCLVNEHIGNLNRKYKYSNKRLYSIYKGIIERCYNDNNSHYGSYGGRGIKVCDEWLGENGYDTFAEWSYKNGYNDKAKRGECTIDRIDVDGDYSTDNCRWVSNDVQQNNRRDCRYYEYNGEKLTIAQLARRLNVTYSFLKWRLDKGVPLKDIVKEVERKNA